MRLTPISDHIVVKPVSQEEKSASGIIIPDTVSKERPERGEVISVGPGRELENGARSKMDVAAGQIVLFKKYAPDEVKIGGEEFLVIKMEDVMAVVES
ncbi:co-chaperone GroES [Candidatus Parcubacteria bacterium]|nr:co-chaperone GroES [Candidatus Parcubacteria bacterium]